MVDRQLRVMPIASTIVRASTNSTNDAVKVAASRPDVTPRSIPQAYSRRAGTLQLRGTRCCIATLVAVELQQGSRVASVVQRSRPHSRSLPGRRKDALMAVQAPP